MDARCGTMTSQTGMGLQPTTLLSTAVCQIPLPIQLLPETAASLLWERAATCTASGTADGDGKVSSVDEIYTHSTGNGFQGAPAISDGILAIAPCNGLQVFL